MRIKKWNVNEEGLNRFFGPLEARIMDILWSEGDRSIKEVQEALSREEPISVNAVMTVMNRLLEKGFLTKAKYSLGSARAARFRPIQSQDDFMMEQMKAVSHGLIREYGSLVVTHMIDELEEADPDLIARLEQKLNEMKSGKKP